MLLLSWPLQLSPGGRPGLARPAAASVLHVSLNAPGEALEVPAPPIQAGGAPQDGQGGPAVQDAVPLPGYYPAGRLSRMPEAIGIFDVQPPSGGDSGIGGKVTLRIWIGAKGGIDSVRVLSSGLPPEYADAALAAFGKMRFTPGEINGVPVQSWVDVVIEYADFQKDAGQPVSGSR
jgi:TonB family protein